MYLWAASNIQKLHLALSKILVRTAGMYRTPGDDDHCRAVSLGSQHTHGFRCFHARQLLCVLYTFFRSLRENPGVCFNNHSRIRAKNL